MRQKRRAVVVIMKKYKKLELWSSIKRMCKFRPELKYMKVLSDVRRKGYYDDKLYRVYRCTIQ